MASKRGVWDHTKQKPRLLRSPLWVQSISGLSWPCQELLQTLRSSMRTSASIRPGGSSSKSDTEPQPNTWQRVLTEGGLAPLRGSRSSLTAGPRTAESFSCGKNAGVAPPALSPHPQPSPTFRVGPFQGHQGVDCPLWELPAMQLHQNLG